jgi:hypothetical protein
MAKGYVLLDNHHEVEWYNLFLFRFFARFFIIIIGVITTHHHNMRLFFISILVELWSSIRELGYHLLNTFRIGGFYLLVC